jgi:hypothetical protein
MAGRFRPRRRGRGRLEDDRLKLQNDVRIGLLQAVAGVAVIAAVVVTWQQLETDRRQLRQQLEVAGATQAAERFVRALDQLGSEQLDVRLGGIYGLERVAARAAGGATGPAGGAYLAPPSPGEPASVFSGAEDRLQVFEILSAYVRTTRTARRWGRPPRPPSRCASRTYTRP